MAATIVSPTDRLETSVLTPLRTTKDPATRPAVPMLMVTVPTPVSASLAAVAVIAVQVPSPKPDGT